MVLKNKNHEKIIDKWENITYNTNMERIPYQKV